ncbi:uncharacterized protein PAC_02415 [Phialocephala subalpina]|uniref:Uncharacterized protein n=1 Tax=Phialocephala subalpina TaxID=576137 RepID=A0A1L7WIF2_9HELO|nr:uncharacterized protein PAC_02415 [Phialocephala subalpina]
MEDANLDESHKNQTENFNANDCELPRPSLREAMKLEPVLGTDDEFSAYIPSLSSQELESYCSTLILETAKMYSTSKHATMKQPHSTLLRIQHLDDLLHGYIRIFCEDIKVGDEMSVIQIDLSSAQSPTISVVALVTMGKISSPNPTSNLLDDNPGRKSTKSSRL